ncbi:thiazole biosynthesis protein ThiJ [Gemmatimonadetes bacterium T265]|nr:thiazole biosynthesis protein ThiJ [Gemmatimonadetes bacterium T265]
MDQKILIVVTNGGEFRKVGWRTGLWFSELTHFWDVAEAAGYAMDIASPAGGNVPIDPESLVISEMATAFGLEGAVSKHYRDRAYMDRLEHTLRVADVEPADYAAIYLAGGHGALFDFADSPDLAKLVADFYEADRIVSAVCHGPSGLLNVRLSSGDYLVAGKQLTGFSWSEEKGVKRDAAVPFSLEERLQRAGADYRKAVIPFVSYVVEDGRLITGQNPGSAHAVGEAVVKRLRADGALSG